MRCRTNGVHPGLRCAEQAGRDLAERDDAGAGERRHVHQMRRAELTRVPERVTEDEPTFGVGIVHFDGEPRAAPEHVARLQGTAPGHIFSRRDYGHDANGDA